MTPPPTPKRALKNPAESPIAGSATTGRALQLTLVS
jgi:hypothetical protein